MTVEAIPWDTAKCIPIGYMSYLSVDLVVNICKGKNKKQRKNDMTVCKISEFKVDIWN